MRLSKIKLKLLQVKLKLNWTQFVGISRLFLLYHFSFFSNKIPKWVVKQTIYQNEFCSPGRMREAPSCVKEYFITSVIFTIVVEKHFFTLFFFQLMQKNKKYSFTSVIKITDINIIAPHKIVPPASNVAKKNSFW